MQSVKDKGKASGERKRLSQKQSATAADLLSCQSELVEDEIVNKLVLPAILYFDKLNMTIAGLLRQPFIK
jgi:hypothetical protein